MCSLPGDAAVSPLRAAWEQLLVRVPWLLSTSTPRRFAQAFKLACAKPRVRRTWAQYAVIIYTIVN